MHQLLSLERRFLEGETHVLLLAEGKDADGDEGAPHEGLAAGALGEAEETPDVFTLSVSVDSRRGEASEAGSWGVETRSASRPQHPLEG